MNPSKVAEISYSAFPSDFLNPELKKQKKYNLDYARAAYFEFVKDSQLLTGTRRNDFINNRLYADGNQPNTKYKQPWFRKDETSQQEYSYSNLDYTPVSVIPGYRDIVLAYLDKMEYDIDLVAIDPISDKSRDTEIYTMWADKVLNNILQQEQIEAQVSEQQDSSSPETMEELQILKQMPPKLRWEIAMKGVLDLDFYRNGWPEIKKKLLEDFFDNGIAGIREFNTRDGRHIVRYCDPVNMYIRMTRDKECKNSTAIGEMIEMTLADLMQQGKDQFTQDEWIQIAKNGTRPYSTSNEPYDYVDTDNLQSGGWISWFTNRWGDSRIKIFDLTWMTTDFYTYESKTNAAGEKMIYDKPFGHEIRNYEYSSEMKGGRMLYFKKEAKSEPIEIAKSEFDNGVTQPKTSDRKAIDEQVKMVYGCKWIMGTEFIYDYGQQYDIPRDPMPAGAETNLPYHIYRLTNKSIVERMKPFEDAFMMSWLKIQNAKARARPKGIKIELDALENMTIAGKKFTPLQALSVYDQTGNIIYKGTGQFGEPTRHSPVEETQGGMGAEYAELIGDLNLNISMMRQVSGFNEIFLASSPDPNQPVGTAQLAVEASNNALWPLMSSLQNIHIRGAKSTICRYQITSHSGRKAEGYDAALSEPMRKVVEYSDDFSLYKYGMKVIARPSKEQRGKIEMAAIEAMKTKDASGAGEITYPDYLFILRILEGGNLHYADAVLAARIQKRKQEKTQEALAMQKANGEEQRASAAQSEQDKRATLQFETDQNIRLAIAEGEIQIKVDTNKMLLTKDNEIIKAGAKIKQTETQTAGKLIGEHVKAEASKEKAAATAE